MFGTIRRHQQWLWIIIIAAIIISFVWYLGPVNQSVGDSFQGNRKKAYYIGDKPVTINGKPITLDEFRKAHAEVYLAHFMRSGGKEWPENDEATTRELERNAIIRIFLHKKLEDMNIDISEKAVAQATRERLGALPMATFVKEYLQPRGLTAKDFERFMRAEVGIQQLAGVAGVSGRLINVKEAEKYYRKENEQMITELAVFSSSNYVDKVTATPEDLAKYYSNHMAMYRVGERTIASYVEFPASNYFSIADQEIAKITNLQARIDEMYVKMGTNAFVDTNGNVMPEKEAKEKILKDQRTVLALREGRREAAAFGDALYSMAQPNDAENLQKLAAAKGYEVKATAPFDFRTGLDTNVFPQEFKEQALKLTRDQPIAFRPLIGEEAIYVMALKGKVSGEMPPLEKVTDKVTTDFKNDKAREMARAAGTNFHATVTNVLAQGKGFAEACKQAGIEAIQVPPFSQSTMSLTNFTNNIPLRALQQIAINLQPGTASDFRPSFDGGYVLFLRERKAVDEEQLKKEFPDFVNRMRRVRQNEALDQWFRKQVDQAKVVIPTREATPPANAGAPPS